MSKKTLLRKLKYKYLRLLISWRNWRRNLSDKVMAEPSKISPYGEKAIRLWKILVKDEETKLSYNSLGVRQIEKNNIFMILQPGYNNDFIITLMDVASDRRNLYELRIPFRFAEVATDHFDYELEKRMKKAEKNKRVLIENDIDKLLEEEEKSMIQKMQK